MSTLLSLHGVDGVRGGRRLFSGLALSVDAGELLRVQGRNGAGKTSLLRLICGLAAPAAGEVRWRGEPIQAQRDAFHRELVFLGHAAALKDDLSAVENLRAACAIAGIATDEAAAAAAVAAAGLGSRARVPARLLSQGQRKRAALARLALPHAGALLWVLDEPFNALDADATGWLLERVRAQLERGGAVVLTSHQPVALDAALRQRVLAL